MNFLDRYISTARPLSSGKLSIDSKKVSNLFIKKSKNFSKINLSELNKDETLNHSLNKTRNSKRYNIPFLSKYRHIDINIIKDLTSNEQKGFYTYDIYNTINNSNNTKRSFFEEEPKIEHHFSNKKGLKKLFLTTPVPQVSLNYMDDLSNMKTLPTLENEGKNNKTIINKKNNNNKNNSKIKIKRVKTLEEKKVTLENILLKQNIENHQTNNSNKPKLLKRNSIVDRLVFQITNPDECFEEYLSFEKPVDKYIKFKKQLKKKQLQTYKMLLDVELDQKNEMKELKKYNATIQRIEFILKTKYNNQYLNKYKKPY